MAKWARALRHLKGYLSEGEARPRRFQIMSSNFAPRSLAPLEISQEDTEKIEKA